MIRVNIFNSRIIQSLLMLILILSILPSMHVRADEEHSDYASPAEQVSSGSPLKYGMNPIHVEDVKDGTYDIEVASSSSFFKVNIAKMYVKDGEMTADLVLASQSYLLLYMGTGEEAAKAPAADYISFTNDSEGNCIFNVPVKNLNEEIDCAAFSKRRKKWYDRRLVFDASTLPEDAIDMELPDYDRIQTAIDYYDVHHSSDGEDLLAEDSDSKAAADSTDTASAAIPMDVNMEDGEYSIEVNMTGGSGRASISSPTLFIVEDGKAYARLLWSSTYYDYMIVGGQKYMNETTDGGNSTFTIPVSKMDRIIPVIADTTAMGDPVEIEYSLTFYENTIGPKGMIPQEAAKKVLIFALIIIIVGGILNHIVKKRRKGR